MDAWGDDAEAAVSLDTAGPAHAPAPTATVHPRPPRRAPSALVLDQFSGNPGKNSKES